MSTSFVARAAFVTITATALAVLIAGTACTRRGGNGVTPPTTAPITTYYVNPVSGSDSNSGTSSSTPFRTIKKALAVVYKTTMTGLTISLAQGTYSAASGESFPIVIPIGVVIAGNNYGHGATRGSFIEGFGEDTTLEKALGKPAHTYYATLEIPSMVSVSINRLYVGGGRLVLPPAAQYDAVDDLGTVDGSQVSLGAMTLNGRPAGGILVPSGTLNCTACVIGALTFGIEAFSLPAATSPPTLILSGPGESIIGGADGIRTDGTANITASDQSFQSRINAYNDSLAVPTASPSISPSSAASPSPGTIDFGYGANGSLGGNVFIGSTSELSVVLPGAVISARNDTWNVAQGANPHGRYGTPRIFKPGTSGQNVTISTKASGAFVDVGPAPPPTPTPSPTPSTSASPSPTASPT
jgi:hypothetical protein